MTISPHTMVTGDVARALGYSDVWVRSHDAELEPVKLANGQRRYDPSKVEAFAKKRAAVRGTP